MWKTGQISVTEKRVMAKGPTKTEAAEGESPDTSFERKMIGGTTIR
jgi:hypothetical protein